MRLTITNTIDHNVIYNQEVTDKGTSAKFYTLDITLPDGIPDGEYEYTLMDADGVLSTGIMTILGANRHRKTEYEKDVIYEQYETDR